MSIAISGPVDSFEIDERFNVTVRVSKSIETDEPDTCEIDIYNLGKSNRDFIGSVATHVAVKLGYQNSINSVFVGDIINVSHKHEGPEWITTIQSGDKGISLQVATMNKTYAKGTRLENQLKDLALSFETELEIVGDKSFADAALLKGKSYTLESKSHMKQIAIEHGLDWAIQEGVLVVVKKKDHRGAPPIVLNYSTGLLYSPELNKDDKTQETRLNAIALLNPNFKPGDTVVVQSQTLSKDSAVNIKKVVFNANSRMGEFTAAIEGVIL